MDFVFSVCFFRGGGTITRREQYTQGQMQQPGTIFKALSFAVCSIQNNSIEIANDTGGSKNGIDDCNDKHNDSDFVKWEINSRIVLFSETVNWELNVGR